MKTPESREQGLRSLAGLRAVGTAALFLLGACVPGQLTSTPERVSFADLRSRLCEGNISIDGYLTFVTKVPDSLADGLQRAFPGRGKLYPYVLYAEANVNSDRITTLKIGEPVEQLRTAKDALRRKLTVTGDLTQISQPDGTAVCVLNASSVR